MSTDIAVIQENDLIKALQNSVYVDASEEALKLVLTYCKHANLDPMLKPVHIANIDGKDILMPGIGLARIRAHRTGSYVGLSEPKFGEVVTEMVGKTKMTYPVSCSITIKKLVAGQIVEFVGTAFWKESYATVADKVSPNIFWYKRPYSMLCKTAEADALKKAFPDHVSAETEETHANLVLRNEMLSAQKVVKPALSVGDTIKAKLLPTLDDPNEVVIDVKTGEVLNAVDQEKEMLLKELKTLIKEHKISTERQLFWKSREACTSFTEMSSDSLKHIIDTIKLQSENEGKENG